jgi:predicted transcriptional regulator
MVTELLGRKDCIRILLTLRKHKGLRFSDLMKQLALNPNQVSRAVKYLRDGLWILPRVVPIKGGRNLVQYELSRRGEGFLEGVIDSVRDGVRKNVAALGVSELREVQALYR